MYNGVPKYKRIDDLKRLIQEYRLAADMMSKRHPKEAQLFTDRADELQKELGEIDE
jgi:hypothetical protein